MFVGHYSAALVAKAAGPRVPLWVLLLAAQFVDVLWAIFVLVGIEHVRLDPSLASNALDLHDMPYTHSLVAAVAWGAAMFFIIRSIPRLGGTLHAGLAAGLVVVSHWVLDFVVHRPDLTLWGGGTKLGLALWNYPLRAFTLELLVLFASAAFYIVRCELRGSARLAVVAFTAALVVLQTISTFGPVPGSVTELVSSALAVFIVVAGAGTLVDRWTQRSITT